MLAVSPIGVVVPFHGEKLISQARRTAIRAVHRDLITFS